MKTAGLYLIFLLIFGTDIDFLFLEGFGARKYFSTSLFLLILTFFSNI